MLPPGVEVELGRRRVGDLAVLLLHFLPQRIDVDELDDIRSERSLCHDDA